MKGTTMHKGIIITRELTLFPRSLKGEINAWCVKDLTGQHHAFKTRKQAHEWIEKWCDDAAVIRHDFKGNYYRYTVKDGAFVYEPMTKQDWMTYRGKA